VEVSYTTTVDDYVAFALHLWRKSKVGRGSYLVNWLLLPVLGLLGPAAVVASNGLSVGAAVCAGGALLYAAIFPACYRLLYANYIRAYAKKLGTRGVIGPIRLILSEESLVEITEKTRSETRWRDIEGIEEADGYTFILVTGMTAAILPRQGFEREDDYRRVRDFARARIRDGAETAPDVTMNIKGRRE
jgi:hypothetical protein